MSIEAIFGFVIFAIIGIAITIVGLKWGKKSYTQDKRIVRGKSDRMLLVASAIAIMLFLVLFVL